MSRWPASLVLVIALGWPAPVGADVEQWGFLALRGEDVRAAESFLEGGFGRLPVPGRGDDRGHGSLALDGQLALRWSPRPQLAGYLHLAGRATVPEGRPKLGGDVVAVVEAYLEAALYPRGADRLRLRAGPQILPVALHGDTPLWQAPDTVTFSPLATWIGEEVRPIGIDADYELRPGDGEGDRFALGVMAFGGNDTAGALLAWRGWSLGRRMTGVGELLPLPPIASLSGGFAAQRDDGTRASGRDLDGRAGWHARLGWRRPERLRVVAAHYDNRGDRALYRGEYAWRTRFDLVAVELSRGPWTVLGEAMVGDTGMGSRRAPAFVDADLRARSLTLAWRGASVRLALRADRFAVADRDRSPRGERNDEDGDALAVAARLQLAPGWWLSAELLDVRAERPGLAEEGQAPRPRARVASLELRYEW